MKLKDAEEIVELIWKRAKLNNIKFKWGNMKKGFGYYRINNGKEEICMSKPLTLLNSKKEFINSLLHEICHAIVGPLNGHNWIWKQMATRIGCDANRCYDVDELNLPKGKYKYQCPNCKRIYHLYRQLKGKRSCGDCCNKYNRRKYSNKFVLIKVK